MQPTPRALDLLRSCVTPETLELSDGLAQEIVANAEAWPVNTISARIAQIATIEANRREIRIRHELAPKCIVCAGVCEGDDRSFCSDPCHAEHYGAIANAAALDGRTTAFMDERQMGEVA